MLWFHSHVWIKMGSIASVLQWHCQTCGQINPTESVKCLKCGTKRHSGHDTQESKGYRGDSSPEYTSRTGKSEGTTPGSEPIVIPTENKFNRWVFLLAVIMFIVGSVIQNIDFSWSLFRLYFHCIVLLRECRRSSLTKLYVDTVLVVGVSQ